jgi:hypothetical protein
MIPVEEIFTWKDDLARKAFDNFGHRGAHCNLATYERIRRECQPAPRTNNFIPAYLATVPLSSFHVHVKEGVPDGMLERCDCGVDPAMTPLHESM